MGRYSVGRFCTMVAFLFISLLLLYIFNCEHKNRKKRCFKVVALLLGLIVSIIIVDTGARLIVKPRYVRTDDIYHRPPNIQTSGVFRDIPETRHSYTNPPKGYPDVPYTLTVDKRGFRNRSDFDTYDVLVLGDSFAEGSKVTDQDAWPTLYESLSGKKVYNLGMSGGNPGTYVETLEKFGVQLSPDIVFLMLYEGNDFRGSGELIDRTAKESGFRERIRAYYKSSPLRSAVKRFLINTFSFQRSGVKRESTLFAASNPLSWMPVSVSEGNRVRHYDFTVKRLLKHYVSKEKFMRSSGMKTASLAILKIKEICKEIDARLIVVFAPDKPHVVMPLIRERVSAESIREFLALKKRDLPGPKETKAAIFKNLSAQEEAVREFCEKEGIEFVSVTNQLRESIKNSEQAYFTYDQHWTPIGHSVVAEALYNYLEGE